MTHPEIQGDPTDEGKPYGEGYLFWVEIEGEKAPIYIWISDDWESAKGEPSAVTDTGIADPVTGEFFKGFLLVVYQHALESINHLYHAMGHEGCHIYDLITTKGNISEYELEFNGYWWNFSHRYGPYPYPYSMDILFFKINAYMPGFLRGRIPA